MEPTRRGWVLIGIALGFAMWTARAARAQYPAWYNLEAVPPTHVGEGQCGPAASLDRYTFEVGCYDVRTGAWMDCETRFESRFDPPDPEDVAWTGGHSHNDGHRPIGNLFTVPSMDQGDAERTWFAGQTSRISWCATKTVPEVSGVITVKAWYKAPPNSACVEDFLFVRDPGDYRACTGYFGYDVGDDGFEELPPWPNVYVRCGLTAGCLCDNISPTHPNAFWGTPEMVAAVEDLAVSFQALHPELMLRITDMSLPRGGLFDLDLNWKAPRHCRHRTGTSVDISKYALTVENPRTVGVDINALVVLARQCHLGRVQEESIHFELHYEGA